MSEASELLESYVEVNLNNYDNDDVSDLQLWAAKAYDELEHAAIIEREFNRIIGNLDTVFQVSSDNQTPFLPDFLPLGACKSEGVIELAKAYLELQSENARLSAIERAAREYRKACETYRGPDPSIEGLRSAWNEVTDTEKKLFGLLERKAGA